MIGQTISHYKILEKLGEGGMGVVYKAEDLTLHRSVALKFLPGAVRKDSEEMSRFLHEAQAISALNHAHIATIHSMEEDDGQKFLVLEYIEGGTLKERIKSGPLPIDLVVEFAIQIAEGLAHAHSKGIVHRDLKSDNVMLTAEGKLKITDFGLAKLHGMSKVTKAGSTVGTAAYMSPEQARGEDVDQRSDIFSFGVVLYELISGELPFKGLHEAALMYEIVHEQPKLPREIRADVPDELQKIVDKAIEKNAEKRFQQMDEALSYLRALQKVLDSGESRGVRRLGMDKLRRKFLWLIPVAATVIGAIFFFIFRPHGEDISLEKKTLAVMYFENIPDPADRDMSGNIFTDLLITSFFQMPGLIVISRERLDDLEKELARKDVNTKTAGFATRVAQRAGASMMVIGSIIQKQPSMALMYRLIDVSSGKLVGTQRLSGFSSEQMFAMVDSVAHLIKNDLNIGTSEVTRSMSVSDVTTNSLEAYRAYLEGIEYRKKFLPQRVSSFKRAVELDTNFAMAHFYLAMEGQIDGELEKAWRLRNRVTEKERLLIESMYISNVEKDHQTGAEKLEELLRKYPHEQRAYYDLFQRYRSLGEFDKARKILNEGLKNDPSDAWILAFLSHNYAMTFERNEALSLADQYLRISPGSVDPYDTKGSIYQHLDEYDSALVWYDKALTFQPDIGSAQFAGMIMIMRQNYAAAEKYFELLGKTSDDRAGASSKFDRVLITMHKGQLIIAMRQLDTLFKLYKDEKYAGVAQSFVHMKTAIAYELNDFSKMVPNAQSLMPAAEDDLAWAFYVSGNHKMAQKMLDSLERRLRDKYSVWTRAIYPYAQGLIAYEEQKYDSSVTYFNTYLKSFFPNRTPLYFYALSLLKNNQLDAAAREFERMTWWAPTGASPVTQEGRPDFGFWPIAAVKAHYWLGVIHDQEGQKQAAIKNYENFLVIWKDADFKSKELEDAKVRLAVLKGEK